MTRHAGKRGLPMSVILLSGFAPFLDHAVNPSALVAGTLDGRSLGRSGMKAVGIEVPVTYAGAFPALRAAAEALRPVAIVMFGLAYETETIRLERLALNLDDAASPDNDGTIRRDRAIVPGGPVGYWSSLPLGDMADSLAAAGFVSSMSRDAGAYLCNHLFYRTRHWLEERTQAQGEAAIPAGFVHLPPLPEQIRLTDRPHRQGMEQVTLLRAVEVMLTRLADNLPQEQVVS
jgi:pyroglutamyl-peptidase